MRSNSKTLIVLVLIVCLVVPSSAAQTWSRGTVFVAGGTGGSGTTVPCSIATISAGSVALALFRIANGGLPFISVADDEGQTWTQIGSSVDGSFTGTSLWYKENHPGGTTVVVTATFTTSAAGRSSICGTYTGLLTSGALDKFTQQSDVNAGSATDAINSGLTASTTESDELVLGLIWQAQQGLTISPGTGFSENAHLVTAANGIFLVEDMNLATPGVTQSVASTTSTTSDYHVYVATFKGTSGVPAASDNCLLLLGVSC